MNEFINFKTMKSMGLRANINWLAWFLSTFIVMIILCVVIILFLKFGEIHPNSDWTVIFVLLLLFSFSTLMLRY